MSEICYFCGNPLNPFDHGIWKQVVGWVGGPRKDSMTLREDTKRYAHDGCIEKLKSGQSIDQPTLLGDDVGLSLQPPKVSPERDISMLEELIGEKPDDCP